jgi:hypothetical protein
MINVLLLSISRYARVGGLTPQLEVALSLGHVSDDIWVSISGLVFHPASHRRIHIRKPLSNAPSLRPLGKDRNINS